MDRTRTVSSRDLQALAQPLFSKAEGLENDSHEAVDPHHVLKLLGMLGDIAHASIQEKKQDSKPPILKDQRLLEALLQLQNKTNPPKKPKASRP